MGSGKGPMMGPGKRGSGSAGASTGRIPDGGPCAAGVVGPIITGCGYPYQSAKPLTLDPCVPGDICTRERSCFDGCCL
jgi:hypothetical protein